MRRPVDRHAAQLTMRWGDRAAFRRRGPSRKRTLFIVRDHGGMSLAYVYFEEEPGGRAAAKLLTRDNGTSPPTSPSCRSYSGPGQRRPPCTGSTRRKRPRAEVPGSVAFVVLCAWMMRRHHAQSTLASRKSEHRASDLGRRLRRR